MKYGIKYNENTGEISMGIATTAPDGIAIQATPGFLALETPTLIDAPTNYVVSGAVTARPTMALNIGPTTFAKNSVFHVDGIPVGTTLYYPGGDIVIDDGFFDWSTVEPGAYRFTLQNFPYQEVAIDANVTAA